MTTLVNIWLFISVAGAFGCLWIIVIKFINWLSEPPKTKEDKDL